MSDKLELIRLFSLFAPVIGFAFGVFAAWVVDKVWLSKTGEKQK